MVFTFLLAGLLLLWLGQAIRKSYGRRVAAAPATAAPRHLVWLYRASFGGAALMFLCAAALFLLAVAAW